MQLAVISDLHLGHGDVADRFGHRDSDFLRFLHFLESNFERIVLLGDIWETLANRRLGGFTSHVASLRRARRAHSEIAKRLERPEYSYVHGNHDLIAAQVDAAPEELVINADGTRLLFTHGHHHDMLFQRGRLLSEFGVWVGGWVRRFRLSRLHDVLTHLDDNAGGVSDDHKRCTFQRWAVTAAKARRADVVVTGHTHRATTAEHGDRVFMNSGSCADGKYTFLSLDTCRGAYALNSSW